MGHYHPNPDVDLQLKMNGYRPKPPPPIRPPCPDVPDTPPPSDLARVGLAGSVGEALLWALLVGMGCTALWKAVAALLDVL